MIEGLVDQLQSRGYSLQEAMVPSESNPILWHASILEPSGFPISGGFAKDRNHARKVAVAEYLERMCHQELRVSAPSEQHRWGLDIIPTACGFAAGFDKQNTILRSVNESVERWIMSKWIDEQFAIEEIPRLTIEPSLDPVSLFFISHFDEVRFFKKDVLVPTGANMLKVEVGQTMCLLKNGIYPGSSAQYSGGSLWQHALLESFRHLLAVRNNPGRGDRFPDNKVLYFANHANVALEQIARATKHSWPTPSIRLHEVEERTDGGYFIARTIINGWRSWHEGPVERFLY
jgi:hypothetical protein